MEFNSYHKHMELLTQPSIVQSKVLGIIGDHLHGWAYKSSNLHARLVLEVYCDQYSIGCVIADVFEQSLAKQKVGDACYGFVFKLPEYSLYKDKKIRLKLANTSEWLSHSLILNGDHKPQRNLLSQISSQGGLLISGWAWKPSQKRETVTISVFLEHNKLLTVQADQFIPYIEGEQAYHGFEIQLPAKLADGKKHTLRLLDEGGNELNGSPVTVIEYMSNTQKLIELSKTNSGAEQLLKTLLKQYQKHIPRTLGIKHYAQWYTVFGCLRKIKLTATPYISICIIGKERKQKTLDSLEQQDYYNWQIYSPSQGIPPSAHYIILLQAGDHLPQYALSHIAEKLEQHHPTLLYSDGDHDNEFSERSEPCFKPDWNYEYFTAFNYLNPFCVVRANLVNPKHLSDTQQFIYQAIAKSLHIDPLGKTIYHLAKICYHRNHQYKEQDKQKNQAQYTALQQFLTQQEAGAIAQPQKSYPNCFRIIRPLTQRPLVSLIIPTRDQAKLLDACLNSIIKKSTYQNIEIIVINNHSIEQETFNCFKKYQKKGVYVLDYNKEFNYSAINNFAVQQAKGDVIGLINNDVEIISPDWLEEMLGLLLRPSIGAVGAKLLWPNNRVQHGGVILGLRGLASHYGNYLHNDDAGYMQRNQASQQLSAVTAACLLVKKEHYWAVGGLNEFDFPVAFNDVDFCLKLQAKGLRNIWSAHAKLYHFESASRGKEDNAMKASRAAREQQNLKKSWGECLAHDPSYNRNFSLNSTADLFSGLKLP